MNRTEKNVKLGAAALDYYQKNSSKLLAVSIIILLASLFIASYPVSDIYNHFFLPQPERVTELYFDNPTTLPMVAAPDGSVKFTFHTTSHEADFVTYTYVVTISGFGLSKVLKTGNFTLADGQSVDIPVSFSVPVRRARNLVTVQLSGRSESIHFWVSS
jgi:hypothetical protein